MKNVYFSAEKLPRSCTEFDPHLKNPKSSIFRRNYFKLWTSPTSISPTPLGDPAEVKEFFPKSEISPCPVIDIDIVQFTESEEKTEPTSTENWHELVDQQEEGIAAMKKVSQHFLIFRTLH